MYLYQNIYLYIMLHNYTVVTPRAVKINIQIMYLSNDIIISIKVIRGDVKINWLHPPYSAASCI